MKKVLIGGLAVVAVLGLSGCADEGVESEQILDTPPVIESLPTPPPPMNVSGKNDAVETVRKLQAESLKIQTDKTMTKEEKMKALEDVQRRIKEVAKDATME